MVVNGLTASEDNPNSPLRGIKASKLPSVQAPSFHVIDDHEIETGIVFLLVTFRGSRYGCHHAYLWNITSPSDCGSPEGRAMDDRRENRPLPIICQLAEWEGRDGRA